MKQFLTLLLAFMAVLLQTVSGQGLSNKGKEFWVGYGHNYYFEGSNGNTQNMVLYLSAEQAATVTVSVTGTTWTRTYNIPANTVIASDFMPKAGADDARLFSLPASYGGTNSEGVFNKGIHIVSNVPIVAYAHIFAGSSSGATMLMPTETWGYNYVSVNFYQSYTSDCYTWINVISNHDNTRVQITPSVQTRSGVPAGTTITVTLNKGQIYQVLGTNGGTSTGQDLTGSQIKSIANAQGECYPIAVISGSSRTSMGISCSGSSGDNYLQQVFPSQAWGKRYLTAPTSTSTAANTPMTNYFRVVVKDPTTVVKRNGVTLTNLTLNTYYQFTSTTADYITADKPILVAQYMPSSGCYGGSGLGDPEMFYISPIEQAIKSVGFYRNTRESISVNYLTLIVPTAGVTSLRIDGSSTFDYSYPHPNLSGYTVVVKRWTAAQAQCRVTSDSAFTAITYGLGSVESYGYNAGTLINNLNVIGEIRNQYNDQTSTNAYTCKNTPFYPTVLIAYKPTKMVWRFSQMTNVTPNTDVTDLSPTLVDSQFVNGAWYYRYRLNSPYQFSDTGTYNIPILSSHPSIENCNNTEEVQISIVVKTSPATDFNYSNILGGTGFTGCRLDTVYFNGNSTPVGGGSPVNRFRWSFSSDAGDTAIVQNPKKLYLAPGTYNVKFSGITIEGCVGDTTKTITIYAPPTANFTSSPTSACEPAAMQLIGTGTYGGSAPVQGWYWNLGNGQTATTDTVAVNYPTYGSYVVKHVAKISTLCVSDTLSKVVKVYAKPRVNFTYPLGCLSANGSAQFNDATLIPDSQSVSYNWNFGDSAASTSSNPNSSTLQNPSHIYSAYGLYNIKLSVTTANGCSKDTTIAITFSLRPTLVYNPIATICGNQAPLSVANASVSNAVPGAGFYRGPGTDSVGLFNPAIAGAGTHTIWYVFQTTGGCRDSISQTVTVSPVPTASFTYPVGCLGTNGAAQFTNTSAVAGNGTLSYLWHFGDSAHATSANPDTSILQNPVHNYTVYGTYNVKLTVKTASGCVKDTTVAIIFSLKPVLNYPAIASVCVNHVPLSIAGGSVTNAVPGTGIYRGPGTDTAGLFNPAVAGVGTHTIWYIYRVAGGCNDSISQTIKVFAKPAAAFTVSNAAFCADSSTQVTVQSAISSGSIQNWYWDFGNSTTATYQNGNAFTLNYPAGTYTIKHYAVSDSSCVSDTVTKTITVSPLPVARFTPPASVCMPAGQAQFTNSSAVAGGGALTYSWDFGDGSSTVTTTSPLHVYGSSGPFSIKLTATTAAGCKDDTTIVLSAFYDQPIAKFSINPAVLCQGASNSFNDQSTAQNSTITQWQWNFGDGTTSTTANPKKKYVRPGSYSISLNVKNAQGCFSDTAYQTAIVYLQPLVDAGPSFIVPEGTQIRFAALANDTTIHFVWTPGADLSNDTILTPSLVARSNQTYKITATGEGNCTFSDTLTVKILRPVAIPNAFSPNGDGINDTWMIPNLADYPGATIEVYDRYGSRVVRTTGYARPWDGTVNGKPLPIGTYYYIIDLKNGFAPLNGPVTILR